MHSHPECGGQPGNGATRMDRSGRQTKNRSKSAPRRADAVDASALIRRRPGAVPPPPRPSPATTRSTQPQTAGGQTRRVGLSGGFTTHEHPSHKCVPASTTPAAESSGHTCSSWLPSHGWHAASQAYPSRQQASSLMTTALLGLACSAQRCVGCRQQPKVRCTTVAAVAMKVRASRTAACSLYSVVSASQPVEHNRLRGIASER